MGCNVRFVPKAVKQTILSADARGACERGRGNNAAGDPHDPDRVPVGSGSGITRLGQYVPHADT